MKTAFSKLLATTVIGTVLVVCATETAAQPPIAISGWPMKAGAMSAMSTSPPPSARATATICSRGHRQGGRPSPMPLSPRGFRRTCVFDIEITKSDGYEIILEKSIFATSTASS